MKVSNLLSVLLPLILISLFAGGCGFAEKPLSNNDSAVSSFKFTLPQIESAQQIDRVTITVSGPGMGNISQDLTIQGSQAEGFIEVPPGESRLFRAEAFIGSIIYYSGTSAEIDIAAGETVTVNITMIDLTPSIQILEPSQSLTIADQTYVITWIDNDYDDNAQISLYYSSDTLFSNAVLVPGAQGISEDDAQNFFVWNTTLYDSGSVYFIFAKIIDILHPFEISRSPGSLLIAHAATPNIAPSIQIIQPDGVSDACDLSFLITWIDADPDNDAVISLFYCTESPSTSALPISGAQNISEDDETDSFAWDTSSLPDSSCYYIYAEITDNVNPVYSTYSTGKINIDHSLANIPPAPPTNLTAVSLSTNQISLSWMDNSVNELGFYIERKTEGGTFQTIEQTTDNQNSYLDEGLASLTTYYYRVKAFNNAGESIYSNVASASTQQPVPAAPSGLSINPVSSSSLDLDWDDNSVNENGFIIERRSGTSGSFSRIDSTEADTSHITDTGLQPGALYQYRICAYNSGGESGYSNIASGQTLEEIPAPPTNLSTTTQSAFSISLVWSDNSNNEAGFKIERASAFAGPYSVIHTTNPNTQYYLNSSLLPSTLYFYRVTAYNSAGQSAYTNIDSTLTLSYNPAPPQNLQVTATTANSVSLAWIDMSNNETGFAVERAVGAAGSFEPLANTAVNAQTYTDYQCLPLTLYKYRVKAFNAYASSAYSNTVEITTPEYSPFDLKLVPAGIFTMGNEPYGYGNEYHPGNPVDVPEFEMMENLVTNQQYAEFLNEMYDAGAVIVYNGDVYSADTSEFYIAISNAESQIDFYGGNFSVVTADQDFPVTLMTWYGANAFAEYHNMQLPTEAMWEKTARGTYGSDSNGDGVGDGYKYPWGNTIDGGHANYQNSGDPWESGDWPLTSPVGAYDGANYSGFQTYDNSSIYEVYDLCGNVWEWCQDWYGPYQNPHNPPSSGTHKVLRGGSWNSSTYFCRNAYRQFYAPDTRYSNVGFRCVRIQ